MTSKEIRDAKHAEMSTNEWLKEMTYQVALLNERLSRPVGRPKKDKDANRA